MKVLKTGIVPTYRVEKPWFLSMTHECPRCGAQWLLEEGDDYVVATERSPNGTSFVTSVCPTARCMTKVESFQPDRFGGRLTGTSDWDGKPLKGGSK